MWTSHCDIIDVFFPSCRFSINIYAISILIFWRRGIVRSIFKRRRRRREKIWRFLKVGVFCIDGQRSVGVTVFHILDIRTRPSHIVSTHRHTHTFILHHQTKSPPSKLRQVNYCTVCNVTGFVSVERRATKYEVKAERKIWKKIKNGEKSYNWVMLHPSTMANKKLYPSCSLCTLCFGEEEKRRFLSHCFFFFLLDFPQCVCVCCVYFVYKKKISTWLVRLAIVSFFPMSPIILYTMSIIIQN